MTVLNTRRIFSRNRRGLRRGGDFPCGHGMLRVSESASRRLAFHYREKFCYREVVQTAPSRSKAGLSEGCDNNDTTFSGYSSDSVKIDELAGFSSVHQLTQNIAVVRHCTASPEACFPHAGSRKNPHSLPFATGRNAINSANPRH